MNKWVIKVPQCTCEYSASGSSVAHDADVCEFYKWVLKNREKVKSSAASNKYVLAMSNKA